MLRVSRDSTQQMAGAPGTNITRPRAKSAIQKTIMADETTSSVSKVSCLENDRKVALVSLLYSWYLTFGHQGCFLIKKSTAKSPRKRSAGLNCSRFEARGFKHTAHASFPCFQTTLYPVLSFSLPAPPHTHTCTPILPKMPEKFLRRWDGHA